MKSLGISRVIDGVDVFEAMKVSLGRLGVIYAVVLKVVPAYDLIELSQHYPWSLLETELAAMKAGRLKIFDSRLDLEKFKAMLAEIDEAKKDYEEKKQKLGSKIIVTKVKTLVVPVKPPPPALLEAQKKYRAFLDLKTELFAKVRGETTGAGMLEPRHFNIVVNLATPSDCWVCRRWKHTRELAPRNLDDGGGEDRLARVRETKKSVRDFLQSKDERDALVDDLTKTLTSGQPQIRSLGKVILDRLMEPAPKESDFAMDSLLDASLPFIERKFVRERIQQFEKLFPLLGLAQKHLRAALAEMDKSPADAARAHFFQLGLELLYRAVTEGTEELLKVLRAAEKDIADWSGEDPLDFLHKVAKDSVSARSSSELVDRVGALIFGAEFMPRLRIGDSTEILDTHNYQIDGLSSAHSAEFFFDASSHIWMGFVREVIDLADLRRSQNRRAFGEAQDQYGPKAQERAATLREKSDLQLKFLQAQRRAAHASAVPGYMSIRFMAGSSALLGMQAYAKTVAVEVTTLRSLSENLNEEFLERVHASARKHGGIPHWGQEFRLGEWDAKAYLEKRFEGKLTRWKAARKELDKDDAWRTDFTAKHGLEDGV